jgi:hypothetical protein
VGPVWGPLDTPTQPPHTLEPPHGSLDELLDEVLDAVLDEVLDAVLDEVGGLAPSPGRLVLGPSRLDSRDTDGPSEP